MAVPEECWRFIAATSAESSIKTYFAFLSILIICMLVLLIYLKIMSKHIEQLKEKIKQKKQK